jgi:nucleoid DNA-binding protein
MQKTQFVARAIKRAEFVDRLAVKLKVDDETAMKALVNTIFEEIVNVCRAGDEVCLIGFGRFYPKLRRNGTTGKFRLEFRSSGAVEKRINASMQTIIAAAAREARVRKKKSRRRV